MGLTSCLRQDSSTPVSHVQKAANEDESSMTESLHRVWRHGKRCCLDYLTIVVDCSSTLSKGTRCRVWTHPAPRSCRSTAPTTRLASRHTTRQRTSSAVFVLSTASVAPHSSAGLSALVHRRFSAHEGQAPHDSWLSRTRPDVGVTWFRLEDRHSRS